MDLEGLEDLKDLSYLHWLVKHGSISRQLESFKSEKGILMIHYIFLGIGGYVLSLDRRATSPFTAESCGVFPPANCKAWIHELNTAVLPAHDTDACHCKCSAVGCTPLTSLLKGMVWYGWNMGDLLQLITPFTFYLKYFCDDLDVGHHTAALQYLTYTVLNIPHSCCQPYRLSEGRAFYEKVEEIQDEYAYELALLEELLGEFESELVAILQNPEQGLVDLIDFWERTWVGRMTEVLERIEGSDLTDDERRGAEEIGVVWDKMGPEPPPEVEEDWTKLDYWMSELERIEAEC